MPRAARLSRDHQGILCSLTNSKKLNRASLGAECLYFRLLLVCDDEGRHPAEPGRVAIEVFGCRVLNGSVDVKQAGLFLTELEGLGLVSIYTGEDDEKYLQVTNYQNFRRYKKLRFPGPKSGPDGPTLGPVGPGRNGSSTSTSVSTSASVSAEEHDPFRGEELPRNLDTDEFRSAWDSYIETRAEYRWPKWRARTIRGHLAALSDIGAERAVECLRYSDSKPYQGLFPERFGTNGAAKSQTRDERNAAMLRATVEQLRDEG